jgi:hypothetical protein
MEHMKRRISLAMILALVALMAFGVSPAAAQAPPNDDFDDATVISEIPFTDIVDTTDATTAGDDPICFGQGPTVWYQFTPAEDVRLEANTFGSDYDTTLGVYTGSRGDLSEVACNDDAAGTLQSRVRFDADAGETYFFMVGLFFGGPGGLLEFTLMEAPPAAPPLEIDVSIDPVGSVVARDGTVTLSGTVTCSRPVFVELFGGMEQRAGRLIIQGFYFDFIECDGLSAWSATFQGHNGIFKPGKGDAFVEAFVFDPEEDEFFFDFTEASVRLRGSPPR